jgi:hypothetical protein
MKTKKVFPKWAVTSFNKTLFDAHRINFEKLSLRQWQNDFSPRFADEK